MVTTLIGMGSNIDPETHLTAASHKLRGHFEGVRFSSVYSSKAVGMDGDDFLNACCVFEHDLSHDELLIWLKKLEDEYGRDRSEGSWKPRTLDLDILMIDGDVLDDDVYRYGHAFVPASELVQLKQPGNAEFAEVVKVDLNL
ncbi:MAG: 2-amino-4-hydroxy-6-hydroxymethyldihydropteridine diphosphokinase [Ghiorsea sp.]